MRVGVISFQHESNTFLPTVTRLEDFQNNVLAVGEDVRRLYATSYHEMGGFFQGLVQQEIEAVPLFAAVATASGLVTADTYKTLLARLFQQLDAAGNLDGLLVAPHGAAVSEEEPDMDGHWLTALRQRFGSAKPIVCTLDPHANITARMIDACDATVTYRTNPHLDQRERGIEAAKLIADALRQKVSLTQAASFPPVSINIERQLTDDSPCRELEARVRSHLSRPGVLSTSVAFGFPYADVLEMGTSFIAVTNGDRTQARQIVDTLSAQLCNEAEQYRGKLISVDEALDLASRSPSPVCLLDMGDNVGGGSPADGTILLHALHRRAIGKAFVCLYDPAAVDQARSAGVGARLRLSVGGKTDALHGEPFTADFEVIRLHDGVFEEPRLRHGGAPRYNMGPTAVLRTGAGVIVMVTSLRISPYSLVQLTCCGLDPRQFSMIVAKGVHAPVAAYREVCPTLIRVNTPGVTTADMTQLEFRHRRKPLFPFEPIPAEYLSRKT